ncbi:MAG TPA: cytochrome C [Marivita sp.]|nr:cytochrome C [Marivita sp.]
MKLMIATAATAITLSGAAFAEGDAEAGAKEFNKCKSCHMIVADDGTEIVKGGRTGPNLYGIIGRQAGVVEDFRYGDSLVAAGEAGLVWDEESFVAYVQDPRGYLREYLDDSSARSKMSYRLRSGMEDVYAYLVSVGPEMEEDTGS